ncbi:sugar glycosyltransferase [Pantoea sp. Acro-805]|uniref:Sugar glycosyltransferase n=1 Tax=Candidatus Pantoea formicae TaxID=2608355 RepID=A0ABX0R4S7_9GAMM|nr:sugar glycosyltransferase [Pantoea formicae]MDF7650885.1 sugar glycosyltransferase [Erwiniaceae bacterium L1_54_3]NIF02955.1 sugar glycosyltransferase [Pantoea formicae]
MVSIFKQLYRYSHPRVMRHNENFWPYIAIRRASEDQIQKLTYCGKNVPLVNLNQLRAKASGDMTILATGPSVNTLDLQKLSGTTFIGVNGAYHLRKNVRFSYYVIVDRGFVKQRADLVKEVLRDEALVLFTTVHCLNDILKYTALKEITCRLAIIEDLSFKVFRGKVMPHEYERNYRDKKGIVLFPTEPRAGFSWDIRQGIFDAGTVAYWALQIAAWLGANRILLAGVDMNNFAAPRFYETEGDQLPSFLSSNFEQVIKPAFLHASKELERAKIKTYNLCLNSGLGEDVFEKITPELLFPH